MSGERSLLERLANPQAGAPRTTRQNESQLVASVLDHLARMLNTRRGNAPVAPDYGIPDLVDLVHSFPDAIRTMEQAIRATIEKYEPRLSNVRVRYSGSEDDVFSIHFDVTAVLSPSGSGRSVLFETKVGSDGKVSIRS
ncbi:MAG TPA: type VI secretion system baseplate subunit TssE [Acidobacteriota bacterium]|nr:type VI secretion system baseplate subunit TssE [Acidobacteriota bacterium]